MFSSPFIYGGSAPNGAVTVGERWSFTFSGVVNSGVIVDDLGFM
jgi:hypothetical protein